MNFLKKIFPALIILFFVRGISFSQDSGTELISDTIKIELFSKPGIDTNKINVFPKKYSSKKTALVLSGGGARGISQLGVLEILEQNRIYPDMIVGTSIGSIVGGFYSSGYKVSEIENILYRFNWNRALSLTNKYQRTSLFLEQKKIQDRSLLTIPLDGIKPVLLPSSFSNGQYLSEKINSYILNSRYHSRSSFSDLMIPFYAVATDLDNGHRVILDKGNLSECIKASFTFPLLYSPINIDGKNLVDGGLTENIPVKSAKDLGADYIIAVNSTSPLRKNKELNDPINTADQILSITMTQLNTLQLKDVNEVITPDLKNHQSTDFSKIKYLIDKGKESAAGKIQEIIKGIDSVEMSESKYFNNFIINPVVRVNSGILKNEINDTIQILTGENFEKYTSIEKNLKMIYKTGYFSNVSAVITRDGNSAFITYNLECNPPLKNISFENKYEFLDSLVNSFRHNNINKTMNHYDYIDFYNDILGKLRSNSYSLVDITEFHFNYDTGTLEIALSSGYISGIEIKGNNTTNVNVISREIVTSTKSPVNRSELNESIRNVMSTNLFGQVSFGFDFNTGKANPQLDVRVIEKNTKAFRFSLKADNDYNFQLLLDLRDENIFGSGIEAGILAAGGLRNRIYQAEVKSNQFFSLPLTFNLNGYYMFRDIYKYQQIIDSAQNKFDVVKVGEYGNYRNGGFSFLFGTQLKRFGTIYSQVFFENQEITDIDNSASLADELRVIKLKFGGIFDTEDVLPFPTSGALLNLYYETANNILVGNQSYSKLYLSYDQYFSINSSQVLRPRVILGFADNTTPLTEQFSMGGEKSFFGMVLDELRGRQITELSLEYRYLFPYKIFFDTYFGIRYDVGNVWEVIESIRFKDLRHGLGFTAAFDTPIGEASFSAGRSFIIKSGFKQDSFIFGPYDFYFSVGFDI
ncbi:MAG: patatin-like phospholipase family protein [Ignavibacteria bacterium]|nr:patatin-like phospholipase family protein [Ignavibacteria bacterium]